MDLPSKREIELMDKIVHHMNENRSYSFDGRWYLQEGIVESLREFERIEELILEFCNYEKNIGILKNNGRYFEVSDTTSRFLARGGFAGYFQNKLESLALEAEKDQVEFALKKKQLELTGKMISFYKYRMLWIIVSAIIGSILTIGGRYLYEKTSAWKNELPIERTVDKPIVQNPFND